MISQQTQSDTITLSVTNSVGSTHEFPLLPNAGVFVGRSSNCRVQLAGDGLSDIHCRIELENGKVWVQDWMSAAGTQVNGETITTKVEITAADVVQIGQHHIRWGSEQSAPQEVECELYGNAGVPERDAEHFAEQPAPARHDSGNPPLVQPESMGESDSTGFDAGFFDFEEDQTYDRETVALLHAEIEDLQAALAQRDAEQFSQPTDQRLSAPASGEHDSDTVLKRMQDLIDEADRSDERVALLEEMLFAAEVASRSEQEERSQLEAWVGDIEKRIGQREDEHKAEIDALRHRLQESGLQQERLQKQLCQTAGGGRAPQHYEETLENLRSRNVQLQDKLAESEKERLSLERRLEQQAEEQERALRDERVSLAQEHAKVSRMRFELSNKLTDIEQMPKTENQFDTETALKIRTLREHLREIHEQEKQEAKDASIATRIAKLWKRVEY